MKNTPIIMVSAKKDDIDKIRGLGLGADDYMTKPFSPSELVARVKAHLARYDRMTGSAVEANKVIEIRGLKIDTTARRVWINGEEKTFTTKEFDLLTFLASHPNHVYTKEELFREIWDMESIGDIATVTVHIKKIREKVEMDTSNPQYIETIWGVGYRFKEECYMLKGKVAVVTGGTRGIGYAIVKKYLENGAKVVLFGSRQETVDKALSSLKAENADWEVAGDCPDLSDAGAVKAAIEKIKEQFGRIDILVNNAGISDSTKVENYAEGQFEKVMKLNVNALFNTIQPTVAIMREQGGGCILNTSSMVSISGQPGGVAYPTSKFAVNGMTLSLARELGPSNIRVNAVAPGITKTDMVAALPEQMIQPMIGAIPLRRIGEPEDIANAFLFLASDMASYVTGEVLSVDGAMRA